MNARQREIRNVECRLEFREAVSEKAAEGFLGTIQGRAIVFNAESQVLDEYGDRFREMILPEAVTQEFVDSQDIKINMLHNRDLTFGRCNHGEGNARLTVDENGLNFEVDVPNCDLGIRARELTKAGVYSGCSFEFWPDQYDIEARENDLPLVRHSKFRMIEALTLGMSPAYLQTTLHAREMVDTDAEREKKEKEEQEAKEREERQAQEERERKEREAVAIARARKKLVGLMGDIDEITF